MSVETIMIPRKIWILWLQGLSEAPFLVRKCVDSWIKENENWEVVILDEINLSKYVVMDLPENILANLPLVKKSNIIRLHLLSKYGGVWADATTFCMKPLDEWIDDYTISGFFAFYKPGSDRIMSSWFMVSQKGCPIVVKLNERQNSFWLENKFNINTRFKKIIIKLLTLILNQSEKTTKYWFSPFVTKWLKVYPYHVFHYMFERLVSKDFECKEIWDRTKRISADGPHKILKCGLFSHVNEDMKKEVDEKHVPMYKLTWKFDHRRYSSSTLLYYLLEGKNINKT
ncbi:MAG: capsular polysaccharide synthesis protein [Candidatus Anammoxibacter sp.]